MFSQLFARFKFFINVLLKILTNQVICPKKQRAVNVYKVLCLKQNDKGQGKDEVELDRRGIPTTGCGMIDWFFVVFH